MKYPPPRLSGILDKILKAYVIWHRTTRKLPKDLRYSTGVKISSLFTDIIEQTSLAQFSQEKQRATYINTAIAKNDTLKFMFYTLYELRGIPEGEFADFIIKMEEVGRMLYGWKRKIEELTKSR
jgi:hypothetical protein